MFRVKPLLILSALMAFSPSVTAVAQTDSASARVRDYPSTEPAPRGIPFSIDDRSPTSAAPIKFVAASEMSQNDRDLLADAESSLQERAGFENLEFNEGNWTYQELLCPALPNHLFVRFSRNDGTRDMSMFSAAIPRKGDGRIRIIPIVRRGYSLFSPAPIGALTIAAFNKIRAEEGINDQADWLGTGLCYAALAGGNPKAEQLHSEVAEAGALPITIPPTLVVTKDGATIRFDDAAGASRVMEWNMFFDHKGKLLKATHSPAYVVHYQSHPPTAQEIDQLTSSGKRP